MICLKKQAGCTQELHEHYSCNCELLLLSLHAIVKLQSSEPYRAKQPDLVNVMKNGCVLSGLSKMTQSKFLTSVRKGSKGGFLLLGKLPNTFPSTCNLNI